MSKGQRIFDRVKRKGLRLYTIVFYGGVAAVLLIITLAVFLVAFIVRGGC